jgi:hypothetical protein
MSCGVGARECPGTPGGPLAYSTRGIVVVDRPFAQQYLELDRQPLFALLLKVHSAAHYICSPFLLTRNTCLLHNHNRETYTNLLRCSSLPRRLPLPLLRCLRARYLLNSEGERGCSEALTVQLAHFMYSFCEQLEPLRVSIHNPIDNRRTLM